MREILYLDSVVHKGASQVLWWANGVTETKNLFAALSLVFALAGCCLSVLDCGFPVHTDSQTLRFQHCK